MYSFRLPSVVPYACLLYTSNPMPESVKDRCARCYEHIFLFSKSKKYFFDYTATIGRASCRDRV